MNLLFDYTRNTNLIVNGEEITENYAENLIPRCLKSKEVQKQRTKGKAEVYTPYWIVNDMLNYIDNLNYDLEKPFSITEDKKVIINEEKIKFKTADWFKDYVLSTRIEITCGEGAFLITRYDNLSGEKIPVKNRIGIIDRKLRLISENCNDEEEWERLALEALKTTYGYEYQVDSLVLCRKNIFNDILEFKKEKFGEDTTIKRLDDFYNIICWNFFQMDGLTYKIPETDIDVFIMDWNSNEKITFKSLTTAN